MTDYTIRLAQKHDAPQLAHFFTALGHPAVVEEVATRWTAWAAAGNSALVAATGDGQVLGVATLHRMIVLHRPRPVGRITALMVDAPHRGRGIGRALVTAAETALADAGCGWLEVTSHLRFVDAHAFYGHLGFEQTSVRLAKELRAADDG